MIEDPVDHCPFGIHGEIRIAGTRTPSRSKLNSARPRVVGRSRELIGLQAGGTTWSKIPPCSSYTTSSAVLSHNAAFCLIALYTEAINSFARLHVVIGMLIAGHLFASCRCRDRCSSAQ
jgi:hypothetical protein